VILVTRGSACQNQLVTNPDRLTGLDSSFLHLERDAAHMHVAGCMLFDGEAPTYDELVGQIVSRLHLVPRYRQRLRASSLWLRLRGRARSTEQRPPGWAAQR